jgi:signal transduction histidine kinase
MAADRSTEPGAAPSPARLRGHGWPAARDAAEAAVAGLVAVLVGALIHDQPGVESRGVDAVAVLLIAAACAPVAFRRTAPLAAAGVAVAVTAVASLGDYPVTACYVVSLVLVAHATSQADVRLNGALGVFSGTALAVRAVVGAESSPVLAAIGGFAVGMLPALVGESLRAERVRTRDAHELARRTEELRDRDVARAVDAERLRIVRDVHDITGHHLSAIALRAAGAAGATHDPVARTALEQIHGLTAEALGQTKRVLGVLRTEAPAARSPSPRLADLEALLIPARGAGRVAAYRVVQEAVTNVMRHADARVLDVVVAYDPAALTVTVEDDGVGRIDRPVRPGGGIEGMRERVALLGGEFAAGPRAAGGWSVRATFPLEARG